MSRSRICRYNCGMELGQFDKKEKKYREASSGVLHTRERCEAMKNTMRNNSKPAMEEPQYQQQPETEVKEPITLADINVRLKRIEKMLFNSGT